MSILRALYVGVLLGGVVLLFGSLQSALIWDHVVPQGFNDWGVLALAAGAAVYGLYLGFTDEV